MKVFLALLLLSLLPGYGMPEKAIFGQAVNDTLVVPVPNRSSALKKLKFETRLQIIPLRDAFALRDSIRMNNYRWTVSFKHLTYAEYRRMTQGLRRLIDLLYYPGTDTVYIQPNSCQLKVGRHTYEEDYPSTAKGELSFVNCQSALLGSCKTGEADVFELGFTANYYKLRGKDEPACTHLEISVENFDTTVVDIEIEPRKPVFIPSKHNTTGYDIRLQGLIRMMRKLSDEQVPDTTAYCYDYVISDKKETGNITVRDRK